MLTQRSYNTQASSISGFHLTEHLTACIHICHMLIKHEENDPFSKQSIPGDEKWTVHSCVVWKQSWSLCDDSSQMMSIADIHQRKFMLALWWDFKGTLFVKLLARNQTIQRCAVSSCTVWINPWSRNIQSLLIIKELCLSWLCDTQVWSPMKNSWNLGGVHCYTHHTCLTLYHQTCTYFTLFKTPCVA